MTGFRVAHGGAQALYKVKPDLTTLGKVIGGGLPVGAFGGSAKIMQHIAPLGPVYQAGTLSGNPLAMAAGLATLKLISEPGFYAQLNTTAQQLTQGICAAANEASIPLTSNQVGGMFGLFFSTETKITNFQQVTACNIDRFKKFFHAMLQHGVYLAPSPFEAGFVSSAHDKDALEKTYAAARKVFATL